MATETKKKKVSVLTVFLWLYAIIVLGWTFFGQGGTMFRGCVRPSRSDKKQKACHSNCKVILGGIELYNMDHNSDYNSTEIPLDPSNSELNGYYKPISKPDSDCLYKYDVDNTVVYCTLHGDPDGYPPGLNEAQKVRFKAEKERAAKLAAKEKYIREMPERFLEGLILPFALLVVLL